MFDIKSANLPLVALLLKSTDLAVVGDELQRRFGDIPDFFDNDPMVVDLSLVQDAEVDFEALQALLRRYRVMPVAVKGGTEKQEALALRAGLAKAADAVVRESPAPSAPEAVPLPSAPTAAPAVPPRKDALVIDKPLRSGQQVYARGRDLIVLSMVNAGAEVIADGHIHVYAPLRGKAIAGARGNSEARILTTCLEPQLVSIAGVYRTSETPWPNELQGKPAQVRLTGDRLAFAALA